MRVFLLYVSLVMTSNLYAAACDTSAMVDNCSVTPTAAKFTFLAIGLCSGLPTLPAVGTAFNYDNCTLIYDKLNQNGQGIEFAGRGDYGSLLNDLTIPPNGTYDYFVWGVSSEWAFKLAMNFPTTTKTHGTSEAVTSGKYCRTISGTNIGADGTQDETAQCYSTYQEPEFTTINLWYSGGIDTNQYFNSNYDAYYIKSDLTLATSFSDVAAVIAIHQPSSPIVITDNTIELIFDWDFDELIRVDIDNGSVGEMSGWFFPYFGSPALTISTN